MQQVRAKSKLRMSNAIFLFCSLGFLGPFLCLEKDVFKIDSSLHHILSFEDVLFSQKSGIHQIFLLCFCCKTLTNAKIPQGITKIPTNKSAIAKLTMRKLVEFCNDFSLFTAKITAQLPIIVTKGKTIVTRLTKFISYSSKRRLCVVPLFVKLKSIFLVNICRTCHSNRN